MVATVAQPASEAAPARLMTVQEVCDLLRVSRWTLDRLEVRGDLSSVHLGKLKRYRAADVASLVNGSAEAAELVGG